MQVTEVARRQVVHNHHDLLGQGLELVALGTYQFEDIGVFLVRHDAGPRGTFIGQLHESEILAVEQAGIIGQLGQCAGDAGQGEGDVALHLATPHLGIDHIIIERLKAQQAGGHRAVKRERRTVAGGRTQRIAVALAESGMQEHHVVHQALGIGPEPQAERRRHGYLQVGVSRHEHVLIGLALRLQRVEELFHQAHDAFQAVAREQLQVEQHLVVARASAMDFLAHIAQAACQHKLHL